MQDPKAQHAGVLFRLSREPIQLPQNGSLLSSLWGQLFNDNIRP